MAVTPILPGATVTKVDPAFRSGSGVDRVGVRIWKQQTYEYDLKLKRHCALKPPMHLVFTVVLVQVVGFARSATPPAGSVVR